MKKEKRSILLMISLILLYLNGLSEISENKARIRIEKLVLKTYGFSDPDPVARPGPIYPYFRFHGYSLKGEPKAWNMVLMENPYLELMIAPEIGGKVWGAREKSSGFDFIYWNPVVKFREIALRGPWTSGGIEFNFGILGHTPTTATPVDFLLEENNNDGSVACIVGTMDLPSRTRWYVRIRLPGDQAIIETEGFWFNPTPFHQSLYHWMTAAAAVGQDLRFYHPGQYFIGHDGIPAPWPHGPDGRDLSYYRNNNFGGSKSYHILGEYSEFFAGIWEEKALGYGHFAFYPDKPGMKLWLWSQARDGEIWHNLLTDWPAPQYIEMQTGFLYNQTAAASSLTPFKHAFFSPYHVIHWKEFWFPLKGLRRVVAASPSGALNVEVKEPGHEEKNGEKNEKVLKRPRFQEKQYEPLEIRHEIKKNDLKNKKFVIEFCPTLSGEKDLRIEANGQLFFQERMVLRPLVLWQREVELPESAENLRLIIGDGEIIWTYDQNFRRSLSRPIHPLEDFNWASAEGQFQMGEELFRQRRFGEAFQAYQNCLKKEPGHLKALTRLAELELRAERVKPALEFARKALMIDAYEPSANFIYGVINRRLGNWANALDGFSWASRSLDFRSGAFTEMAEIFFVQNDLWRAKEYINRALKIEPENMSARELAIIISRKEKKKEETEAKIKEALTIDPLNHSLRFEAYLLEPNEEKKKLFLEAITHELPHETFLELAFRYARLGLLHEARTLLELGPDHPLILLTLAYFLRDSNESESQFLLNQALFLNKSSGPASSSLSPFFVPVFPYRPEMIPIIEWAKEKKPHWKLNYWLALIFWNLGREDEAENLLLACADESDSGPFYLTRAQFLMDRGKEEKALEDIERAIKLEPKNWRAWHRLVNYLEGKGEDQLAFEKAKEIYPLFPENSILILDLARGLLRTGKLKEMLNFLSKVTILPYEGAWEGRDLYRQANLLLAAQAMAKSKWSEALFFLSAARKWPENLGAGRPYEPDERIELYLEGLIYEKQKKWQKARNRWQKLVAFSEKKQQEISLLSLLNALTWKKLGEVEKSQYLYDQWLTRWSERVPFEWAAAIFSEDYEKANKVVRHWLLRHKKKSLWNLAEADHYWPLFVEIFNLTSKIHSDR